MSTPSDRNRQPAGVPTGGQYAASALGESGVSLDGAAAADLDTLSQRIGELGHGERLTVNAATSLTVTREPATDVDDEAIAGVYSGVYRVEVDERAVHEFAYNNLEGTEGSAVNAAARAALARTERGIALRADGTVDTETAIAEGRVDGFSTQRWPEERTLTLVGHWDGNTLVIESTYNGDVADERPDDGYWPEGLWAAGGAGYSEADIAASMLDEYEESHSIRVALYESDYTPLDDDDDDE